MQGEAVPVYREHHLHPFGKDVATIYTNYTNFVAGQPNASAFDIPNWKYCEEGTDAQCPDGATKLDKLRPMLTVVEEP